MENAMPISYSKSKIIAGFALISLLMVNCAHTKPQVLPSPSSQPSPTDLTAWMEKEESLAWQNMQVNISPQEPKKVGDPRPVPGVVVAALSKKDPDYYFHWVRDSAHVMQVLAEGLELQRSYVSKKSVQKQFIEFIKLSDRLQNLESVYGMGEPRYTVTGEVDTLKWSRPQYDGPALRALAILTYLRKNPASELAIKVLLKDLDYVEKTKMERGFDVWEELKGDHYHTRLVQLAALERGAEWLNHHPNYDKTKRRVTIYLKAADELVKLLDKHWAMDRGYLRSQTVVTGTDGYSQKKSDLDSAVVVAVVDANRERPSHSVLDDRVQATVQALESFFRSQYPLNGRTDLGLAYGRYSGDVYFGGNPWYFITAEFAEFYFRLAEKLGKGAEFSVTENNFNFVRSLNSVLSNQVEVGRVILPKSELHEALRLASINKGNAILQRLAVHTPPNGQLYEQMDKVTGGPASAKGIGWSYASLLSALYARQRALAMAN